MRAEKKKPTVFWRMDEMSSSDPFLTSFSLSSGKKPEPSETSSFRKYESCGRILRKNSRGFRWPTCRDIVSDVFLSPHRDLRSSSCLTSFALVCSSRSLVEKQILLNDPRCLLQNCGSLLRRTHSQGWGREGHSVRTVRENWISQGWSTQRNSEVSGLHVPRCVQSLPNTRIIYIHSEYRESLHRHHVAYLCFKRSRRTWSRIRIWDNFSNSVGREWRRWQRRTTKMPSRPMSNRICTLLFSVSS